MRTYMDELGCTVKANTYQEAAEKLYGQSKDFKGSSPTTYAKRSKGCAIVKVYGAGAKIGSYYGVQAAVPIVHTLKIVK